MKQEVIDELTTPQLDYKQYHLMKVGREMLLILQDIQFNFRQSYKSQRLQLQCLTLQLESRWQGVDEENGGCEIVADR